MRVCEEWGSLLLNEDVKVVSEKRQVTNWLDSFFSAANFMNMAKTTVVRAFGLGTGTWALWVDLDRRKVRIRHYDACTVIPPTWDEDGVAECAFVTRAYYRGKTEPNPELCHVFNRSTKDGRDMRMPTSLLQSSVASMVRAKDA